MKKVPKGNASEIKKIVDFDHHHSTQLGQYINNSDIPGAHDHLEKSGISEPAKVNGMIILYNWLYKEMQISDVIIIQRDILKRLYEILPRLYQKWRQQKQERTYQEISNKLEKSIYEYYTNFVDQEHYQKGTMSIPDGIQTLVESINPESPLRKKIQSYLPLTKNT